MYWLDTNVFIEAMNTYYAFTRVSKFWAFLSEQLVAGTICCPKRVYEELTKENNQLAKWVRARKEKGMCVMPSKEVQKRYTEIADHVFTNNSRVRTEEFLTGADGWVVAYALHLGGTVVTQESRSRKRKVRIPAVCKLFDVPCIDTFAMLDRFDAEF